MTRRTANVERRALFAMGAAAALLAATGVSAAGVPKRGGRLRFALSGARRDDDWGRGDGLFMQVARQGVIFDTLVEIAADGTLRPELASDWRSDARALRWQFDLRQDVLFHDGRSLTAADVVASLSPLMPDATVQAAGRHRVDVTLAEPDAGLPFRLAAPGCVIRPAQGASAGIGTGLYRLRQFEAGRQVLAERVETHYKDGRAGWFDEVELVSIPAEQVRAQALSEYLVDAVDLTRADLVAARRDVALLPDAHGVTQAVSADLALPAAVGRQLPLDNLRAPERWWFA